MKEKRNKNLELITDIFIFIIILIFPLLVDNSGYFHILECKWKYYFIIFSFYFLSIIFTLLYYFIKYKISYIKEIKLNKIQISILILLLVYIFSSVFSPFRDKCNLLIGVGRGEGLIISSFYLLSAFFISIFGKFKKRYLIYFSLSSILISFIGFLQYLGFNPFYLYKNGLGFHNCWYITTIGNIDTVSALYCLFLSVSFVSFLFIENTRYENFIHILSLFLGFFIFGIINVLSGKVAFITTFVLIFPLLIINNKRLSKLLFFFAIFLFSYGINIVLNSKYYFDLGKIKLNFNFNWITLLFLIIGIISIYFSKKISNTTFDFSKNKKVIKKLYFIIGTCVLLFIIGVYFIDVKSGILSEIHQILHGNFLDKFGSFRIFLWRRTLRLFLNFPILGSGPDTFAIQFMARYTEDIKAIGPLTINDTAANVYLTMLINLGIVGLFCYLRFLFLQLKGFFNKKNNKYYKYLLIIIICYLIQDFFNLSVVIVSPLFWVLMGINLTIYKQ